jgi:hypothetical protein
MKRIHNRPRRFLLFPLIGAALALGLGFVVMLLWNAILPGAVHAGRLSYWQATGLLLLSRILFGSYRGGRPGGGGSFRRQAWKDKWSGMTPEERDRFRGEWQRRCRPDAARGQRPEEEAQG